jgi:simple sugar transport system permease protein
VAGRKTPVRFFRYPVSYTLVAFVALLVFFGLFTRGQTFFQRENLLAIGRLSPDLGIVSLGVGMLMIAGEFDLSVASNIPLSAFVFVKLLGWGTPHGVMILATLMVGGIIGLLNGLLVTRWDIPSFIITLGTLLFWRGIVYTLSRMMPIGIRAWLEFGTPMEKIFIGTIGGIPLQLLWFVGIAGVLGVLLHFHRFGNWIFVTGDNEVAARAMGIDTNRVKITCYVILGVLCSLMSIIQTLRIESFAANQGVGFELRAIASSVVGGTSLMGGIGSLPGVFLGTLTIQIIENGLILMGAPGFGISAFIGTAIILFAVLNIQVARLSSR